MIRPISREVQRDLTRIPKRRALQRQVHQIDDVELAGDSLIVEAGGRRLTLPSDASFCDVQRAFCEAFFVWVNATPGGGETAADWWSRVTGDAAFASEGGAA